MSTVESIRLDPNADRHDFDYPKDLAEAVNPSDDNSYRFGEVP